MVYRTELQQVRQSVATAALEIAHELEAGRAQTPFQDQLNTFAAAEANVPVRAGILAASPEMARALLADFVGPDTNVCRVAVPSRLGYSEILLQERGFLLDTGGGAREFEDAGAFVEALKAAHALESRDDADLEPLRLKLKGPAHLSGLCLLVPQNLDALIRKPALLSLLADQADWLFLAAGSTSPFSAEQRQAIQLLLDHVTGLQNIRMPVDGEPAAVNGAATEAWWKHWRATLSLGLVEQGSDLLRSRLALLTAPESELRQYLVERRLARQLETTLALLEQELQQSQRMLGNRLQLTREGLVGGNAGPDSRKAAEGIRMRLAEEAESLLKAGEREAKAVLAPDSEVLAPLRAATEAIGPDDIAQTTAGSSIKLSLEEETGQRVAGLVAEVSRQQWETSYRALVEGWECSVRDAERALEKVTGFRHKLAVELPEASQLRESAPALARPEIRYRSEMPRPTLASRFGAARQSIMSLMILGTLFSGAAALTGGEDQGNLRTALYALMLPLLVIGFLWTYVSFRKKEQHALEKEVEKLQDGVANEVRRVVQEVLREQQAVLAGALQRAQRSAQQQIEAAVEKLLQTRQGEAEEQRKRQAEQQRSVEQRVSRLRGLAQQVAALKPRLAQGQKLQSQWLSSWITAFNQGRL